MSALRTEIMGVTFDDVTLDQAISQGEALAQGPGFSYVVTPNPEIVNIARENPAYQALLNQAALVLPDGIGVVYAAKLMKTPLSGRVPGIDFATGLLARLEQNGKRLFLLGAKPGVAQKAAQTLQARFPGLVICGTHHGYFQDAAPVVSAIQKARADVVFVCLGAPKQEQWIAQYGPDTGAHLMVGLGGVLDVYAGNVKRAPAAWQKLGLEWCYRLLHEPSRLGRMAKLPLFLLDARREARKGTSRKEDTP